MATFITIPKEGGEKNKSEIEQLKDDIDSLKRQLTGLRLTVSRLTKKGKKGK